MSITGNPHAEALAPYDDPRNSLDAAATLALAYEQRTANLIAYQANVENSYFNKLTTQRSTQANDLNRQIIERLGLE